MLPPSPPPFRPNIPAFQILEGGADLLRPSPDPPFPPHQLAALGGGSAGGQDAWVPALGPCVQRAHIWIWLWEGKGEEILGVCVWGGEHTWLCSGLSLGRRGARLWRKVGIRRNCTAAPRPQLRGGGRRVGESPRRFVGGVLQACPGRSREGAPRGASSTPGTRAPLPGGSCRREGKAGGQAASSQGPGDVHGEQGVRRDAGQAAGGEAWAPMDGGRQPSTLGTGCPGSGKGADRGCRLHPPLFQTG